jgi:acid phosphatase type 7
VRKLLALAALGASLAALPAGEARAATVLAAGDIASCAPDRTEDTATGDLVEGLEGTVLALGDLAYDKGTSAEFANCYAPVWGSFKARTRPVPGNHEYQTPGAAGFYGYFAGLPKYYKFTLGGWTLYALNPCVASGPGSAQATWFENALKADPNRCQLMYWHPPYISSAKRGSSDAAKNLFAIGYEHRVEIALAGHDHAYERFRQMNPARQVEDGRRVRLFTVGTGGGSNDGFGAAKPGSVVRAQGHGVLRLTLGDAGTYSWSFENAAGSSVSDSGSGSGACLPVAGTSAAAATATAATRALPAPPVESRPGEKPVHRPKPDDD